MGQCRSLTHAIGWVFVFDIDNCRIMWQKPDIQSAQRPKNKRSASGMIYTASSCSDDSRCIFCLKLLDTSFVIWYNNKVKYMKYQAISEDRKELFR